MSEVNLKEIRAMYHINNFARPILDQFAGLTNTGSQQAPYGMNQAVKCVADSKQPFKRSDVIDVFLILQAYGAGKLVEAHGTTEFDWKCNPVHLARVCTGEREGL